MQALFPGQLSTLAAFRQVSKDLKKSNVGAQPSLSCLLIGAPVRRQSKVHAAMKCKPVGTIQVRRFRDEVV